MSWNVVDTLCELIRRPSVNPMGRAVDGDPYLEHRVTDYLQQLFEQLQLPWRRQTIAPRRENIIAWLEGAIPPSQGGSILVFEAHQDTVPVDGMTIPPFDPQVREGRVWGRGACDIKGGMACMLAALSRLVEQRPPNLPTVVMACSVNEECNFTGALQMRQLWSDPDTGPLAHAPDAVIVAEPTLLDVVVAHKGVVRWRCHTRGHAAHSSQPEQGENAVYHMARVLQVFEQYATEVVPSLGDHPLLGRPSLSVGVIGGGVSVNTVPDRCTIEIDRRVLPGEDPRAAWAHARDYVTGRLPNGLPVEHEQPLLVAPGLSDDANAPLAAQLGETARRFGAPGRAIGVPYGTDAPAFAGDAIPTVVFGPGDIRQAHTKDEWIAIEQLELAAEIYYQFACRFVPQGPFEK
jgi:acetylornithine deacetylase